MPKRKQSAANLFTYGEHGMRKAARRKYRKGLRQAGAGKHKARRMSRKYNP